MNTKQLILIGTMAIVLTFGNGTWRDEANASAAISPEVLGNVGTADPEDKVAEFQEQNLAAADAFHQALGVFADDDIYDALYDGQSLADIATEHGADVNDIINLQLAQLTEQLDSRLASGSISLQVYEAQKAELSQIITESVYGGALG